MRTPDVRTPDVRTPDVRTSDVRTPVRTPVHDVPDVHVYAVIYIINNNI